MMTPTSYPTIFHNNPNHAIVSENSQLNGLRESQRSVILWIYELPGIKGFGFCPPSVLDRDLEGLDRVLQVLDLFQIRSSFF